MDLGLKGKRVLVTGGTKSIGRAIVDAFVAEGAVVGFCARDAKLVKERETEWRSKQDRVEGSALDVTDNTALKKWIDDFAGNGGIDHFVANVSALGTEDTEEGWRKAIDDRHRLDGERRPSRAPASREDAGSAPRSPSSARCRSSRSRARPQPYRSVKAALVPFAKSLAIDMAPKGVRANVVSPGTDPGGRQHLGPPARRRRRALQAHAGAQPERPHGHAAGGRGLRRLPGRHARPRS